MAPCARTPATCSIPLVCSATPRQTRLVMVSCSCHGNSARHGPWCADGAGVQVSGEADHCAIAGGVFQSGRVTVRVQPSVVSVESNLGSGPRWTDDAARAYNDAAQRLSKAFATWRANRAGFPTDRRKQHAGPVKFSGTSFTIVDRHIDHGAGRVVASTLKRETGGWFVALTVEVCRPDTAPRSVGSGHRC